MDTTLRDGEQTSGISFSSSEKLTISKLLLEELLIDRIEIASARVSEGELESVKVISDWAKSNGHINKIEVLTFVDNGKSINWMLKSGAKVQNLLTKGSVNHLTNQLKKTPEQHFKEINEILTSSEKEDIKTNVYLEDWSNGMRNSKDYVIDLIDFLSKKRIERILLPDTLGILTPRETYNFISEIINKFPNVHFDFHSHNDYDLSVANVIESLKAGCHGLHLTINGMGERAGNAPMASVAAVINDFLPEISINLKEESLYKVSRLVSTFTGFRIPANKPVVGENVFTQTAGIHADGDNKKNLYFNDLLPERCGIKRKYALGKTSGKANIQKNLQDLGLTLNSTELKKVTERIIQLGDKKEKVTTGFAYIISEVLKNSKEIGNVKIHSFTLQHKKNNKPTADLEIIINGKLYKDSGTGDGQFDAFMNALRKIYLSNYIELPLLIDYNVTIPPEVIQTPL